MHATHHRSRWASLWALTWPQILMLLVQFGIGLIAQCHMVLMTIGIATSNGTVAAVSQSIGAGRKGEHGVLLG